jgi:hypothetical protein
MCSNSKKLDENSKSIGVKLLRTSKYAHVNSALQ